MRVSLRWTAALAGAAIVSGCLSATPPKTPNQRAAERGTRSDPPLPTDVNRRPREAPPVLVR
jgi:hypothetical protein